MDSTLLSPTGFPSIFSQMVAEAAMELPALTRPEDFQFLREAMELAMEAFWENYIGVQSQQAQQEFAEAVQADDYSKIEAWRAAYANFAGDPKAEELGRKILEEMNAKLPSLLREDYASFTSHDHA